MSSSGILQHPVPSRPPLSIAGTGFILMGSPIAWFLQLCAGYALASGPCFRSNVRLAALPASQAWTQSAMLLLLLAALLVCAVAFWMSWHAFRLTDVDDAGEHQAVLKARRSRTRFLARWGMWLGAGFALASLVTTVAIRMLPPCAG